MLLEALEELEVEGVETNRALLVERARGTRTSGPARSRPTGSSGRSA